MRGAKILLVDDEVVFTNNMNKLLTNRGYQVTVANSGESALKALQEGKYDVMVLDLKMPGMDGMTTLKEAKDLDVFTETLILTGHGTIDTAKEAMKLGAYDYLTKPCEIDELVAKIQEARTKKDTTEKEVILKKIDGIVEGRSF